MSAGIKIINDFGTILVDDTYPSLHVLAQGVSTIGSDGSVFIGNYSGKLALRSSSLVGSQYFGGIEGYAEGHYIFGTPSANVEWWIHGPPQGTSSSVGLKVWNAAGQLMFDSGRKVARVVQLRSGPSNSNWQGSISMPGGGRKWAVIPLVKAFSSVMTFTRAGAGGADQYWQREGVSVAGAAISGDSIQLAMTQQVTRQYGPYTGTAVPENYTVASENCAMAVVDMTNY